MHDPNPIEIGTLNAGETKRVCYVKALPDFPIEGPEGQAFSVTIWSLNTLMEGKLNCERINGNWEFRTEMFVINFREILRTKHEYLLRTSSWNYHDKKNWDCFKLLP